MQGMGNYDPSQDKTWLERTSETVKGSVGTGLDAVQRRLGRGAAGGGEDDPRYLAHTGGGDGFHSGSYMSNRGPNAPYGGGGGGGGGYRSEAVSSAYENARASSQAYASQWNQGASSGSGGGASTGGVRGVWGDNPSSSNNTSTAAPPPQHQEDDERGRTGGEGAAAAAARGGGAGKGGFVGRTGGGAADGGYEGKLVEEICAAAGTKSTPGKPELDAFLSKAASLDTGRVAQALQVALEAADWRSRSKGLAVVEALHRSDPSYRIPLEDAFQGTEGGVITLCADPKPAVRDRAVRVSKLLGLDPSSVQAAAAAVAAPSQEDATDGYSCAPDGDPASSVISGTTKAAPSGPAVDLLGGFSDEEGGDGAGVVVDDVLGAGDAAVAGRSSVDDVFGLHDDGAAAAAGPRGASNGAGGGLDELLGMGDGGGAAVDSGGGGILESSSPAAAPDSLFGDLSVKDEPAGGTGDGDTTADAGETKTGAAGGGGGVSGFAFMGSAGGGEVEPVKAEETAAASEGAAGADLLSGFGGAQAATSEGGNLSDMLTMSPGDVGGSGSAATARKTPIEAATTGDNDWLSLAGSGNGQAAIKGDSAAAPPAASVEGGVGVVRGPASSGSLLDDWAGGGGGKSAAVGLADRNHMLQQKVMLMQQQQQQQGLTGGMMGGSFSSFTGASSGVGVGAGAAAAAFGGNVAGGTPAMMRYNSAGGGQQRVGVGAAAVAAAGGLGMRPVGVGGVAINGGLGAGKLIPDVSELGVGDQQQQQQQGQAKGQGQQAAAGTAGAPKAPDSFSFVRDAMQDSIK
ncbi:unnamed protein product [Ectocarpus sp. 13 AM-2016]